MMGKLIKFFIAFIGMFFIFVMIRNVPNKMLLIISKSVADSQAKEEVRDGGADSGFILFRVNSNKLLD